MTDNKAPSYPWYPRDFAADEPVQLMSLEEEGAYRRLLDHQWLHGSIPAEIAALARICKNIPAARMRKLWPAIAGCFQADDADPTRLYNRKLERVREEREAYRRGQSQAGRLGAAKRWGKDSDPIGDPNGDPTSGAIDSPVATSWLASADASASAKEPPSSSARDREGEPQVPEGTQLARLVNRLRRSSDRWAVCDLIDRVPDPQRAGWVGQLGGYLDGVGLPAGLMASPEQLATACRDYAAAHSGTPNPLHFRAFVRRVIQEWRQPRPGDGPAGPRRSAATGQAAIDSGRAWAQRATDPPPPEVTSA